MTDSLERIEREIMIDEAVRICMPMSLGYLRQHAKDLPHPITDCLLTQNGRLPLHVIHDVQHEFQRLDYKRLHQCDEPLAGVRTR